MADQAAAADAQVKNVIQREMSIQDITRSHADELNFDPVRRGLSSDFQLTSFSALKG